MKGEKYFFYELSVNIIQCILDTADFHTIQIKGMYISLLLYLHSNYHSSNSFMLGARGQLEESKKTASQNVLPISFNHRTMVHLVQQ